jgi:hypothetical protein
MIFTQKQYLHCKLDKNRAPRYEVYRWDMTDAANGEYGKCIASAVVDMDFTVPADFDPIAAEVESLKAQQTKLRAEFQRALDENQARINSLLAIENIA